MLKIALVIPAEEVDYLQRFAYEMEAQKRIVKELITDNPDNPAILEGATFKKYHDAYQASAASFEIARDAIEMKFVPEVLRQHGSNTNWMLNYASNILTINHNTNLYDDTYNEIEFAVPSTDVTVTVVPPNAEPTGGCKCNGGKC